MSVEKYFKKYNNSSAIFDPSPSYGGIWYFNIDNLIINSKIVDKQNLFKEYYNEIYTKPLEKIFKTQINEFESGMISLPNANNIGRCLKFNKEDFFNKITNFLNNNIDRYNTNINEYKDYLNELKSHIYNNSENLYKVYFEALNKKETKLKDLITKEINSEYFESSMKDYVFYKEQMDFTTFINNIYNTTKCLKEGMLKLGNFFEQTIDYNKLYNCFSPDTFYLLFAKIIIDYVVLKEKEDNKLENCFRYLKLYYDITFSILKENNYNPYINYITRTKSIIRYSLKDFYIEYKELTNKYKEINNYDVPELNDNIKYKDISLMEKLLKIHNEEVKGNWQFLLNEDILIRDINNKTLNKRNKKDINTLIYETNMRINILLRTDYVVKPIKGINKYLDYYAFVYQNGLVIIERFWNSLDNNNPYLDNITYIIDIDSFLSISSNSNIDLINYFKINNNVKRIFHTTLNNWQRNIYKEIYGTYLLSDAVNFINSINNGENNDTK